MHHIVMKKLIRYRHSIDSTEWSAPRRRFAFSFSCYT